MKIGTETGSLVNHLYSRMTNGAPEPTVGMPATLLGWTDRHPGTVVAWDGKLLQIQEDDWQRTDRNGLSESQTYEYTPNPKGSIHLFKVDRSGEWRECYRNEAGRLILHKGCGYGLILGRREAYRDPSF